MSADLDVPAEYGGGGDIAQARRQRRAFHFTVLAFVVFSGALLLSEDQLRYSAAENQYRNGLTLHPESGRVLLRQAVRIAEEDGGDLPVRYLQALAEREESALILPTFERAFALAPEDAELNMRYGAALFLQDEFAAARDRFADAALHDPENALPIYQQAAAMVANSSEPANIAAAFNVIQRADAAEQEARLPTVLWFQSLPRDSKAYVTWAGNGADTQMAPLFALARMVLSKLEAIVSSQSADAASDNLESLEQIARHIYRAPNGTVESALAALAIEESCLNARVQLAAEHDTASPPDASIRLAALRQAIDRVTAFQSERSDAMESHQRWIALPMYRILEAILFSSFLYIVAQLRYLLLASFARKDWASAYYVFTGIALAIPSLLFFPISAPLFALFGRTPRSWCLPVPRWVRAPVFAGVIILGGIIFWFTLTSPPPTVDRAYLDRANLAWRVIFTSIVVWSVLVPYWWLASPPAESTDDQKQARRYRRRAIAATGLRHLGFTAGLIIIVFCIWGVGTRVTTGAYPHKYELIVSGRIAEEAEVLQQHVHPLR